MGNTLTKIAQTLKDSSKKVQLIYAFNGAGKTRLSREFKNLVVLEIDDSEDTIQTRNTILYYNAFTEDLFYWDNDLINDNQPKLKIQPNSFTDWILKEQGKESEITRNFQGYTSDKLTPNFNAEYLKKENNPDSKVPAFSEVTFSFTRGNNLPEDNIKISKGEESNFIWSIFYTLIEQVISELNIAEPDERSTGLFNNLKYIFIDDPVSSLDENHLIELAVNLAKLIKDSSSDIKFIITTHNPLFYNVLHNEFTKGIKYILSKQADGLYELKKQDNDSPFSYHLYLKSELEQAIQNNQLQKYHFNFLRNILEKTATFLGYSKWGSCYHRIMTGKPIRMNQESSTSPAILSMLLKK